MHRISENYQIIVGRKYYLYKYLKKNKKINYTLFQSFLSQYVKYKLGIFLSVSFMSTSL